jgi:hypothetical protein
MVFRIDALAVSVLVAAVSLANAQEMPNPQAMQMQVQQIMQQRPREAEAAARAFLHLIAMQPGQERQRVDGDLAALDSLKTAAPEIYWSEVAQLTVQFDVVQKLVQRDSVRAGLVTQMFGVEQKARMQQRAYRAAGESQRAVIRGRIETLIGQHFELEDKLRALEIADIERRLGEVRAESQRRREKRAEFVRWAVDDIVRDALRPE